MAAAAALAPGLVAAAATAAAVGVPVGPVGDRGPVAPAAAPVAGARDLAKNLRMAWGPRMRRMTSALPSASR